MVRVWSVVSALPCCPASPSPLLLSTYNTRWCNRRFHDRIDILDFKTLIEVTAPTKAKTTIIAKIDLHCPLPTPMVNFVVRHLAGVILLSMQQQVKRIMEDPSCRHGQRIRQDKHFYTDWLLKKVKLFCAFRGWEIPQINCLNSELYDSDEARLMLHDMDPLGETSLPSYSPLLRWLD